MDGGQGSRQQEQIAHSSGAVRLREGDQATSSRRREEGVAEANALHTPLGWGEARAQRLSRRRAFFPSVRPCSRLDAILASATPPSRLMHLPGIPGSRRARRVSSFPGRGQGRLEAGQDQHERRSPRRGSDVLTAEFWAFLNCSELPSDAAGSVQVMPEPRGPSPCAVCRQTHLGSGEGG